MKWILLAVPLMAFVADAQTQLDFEKELRLPKRIINNVTVDITPLVKWEMAGSQDARPLKPWDFLSGPVVGTNSIGWVVTVTVGKEPQPKTIVLRNPPRAQQDEYNRLVAQQATLSRRLVAIQREQQVAAQRYRAVEDEFRRLQLIRFSGDALDVAAQLAQQAQLDAERVSGQLQNFDWQGHDPARGFIFKGYAVRTGLLYNNAPIYDYGFALK